MLSSFLGTHGSSPEGRFKTPTPVTTEVQPSPDDTDDGDSFEPATEQQVVVTPGRKLLKRQSFLGRVVSGIHSMFHETDEHVHSQHIIIQKRVRRELGIDVTGHILETTYEGLLKWIGKERMTTMPEEGDSWDRVLISAHEFADELDRLHGSVAFTRGTQGLVYGQCLLLLQLGAGDNPGNVKALLKVFSFLQQFSLELRPIVKRRDLFNSVDIQDNLGRAYVALMDIVTDVAIDAYQLAQGLRTTHSKGSLNIYESSESQIQSFRSRLQNCIREMWIHNLSQRHVSDGKDVDALQHWLAPQDSVLEFLASNKISLAAPPNPLTCTWLEEPLIDFVESHNKVLMLEGKTGSGKTILSNWTVARLQRRMEVSTLNFAFNPSIAAQATTPAMLKTLLYQLMGTAIGNVGVYKAIKGAYDALESRPTSDEDEDKLWTALTKSLEAIDEEQKGETFVIILDGVDEINNSSKAMAQKICKKLHEIAQRLSAVRIIQFSEPLGLSPKHSTLVKIEDETEDDIRRLIEGSVKHHAHFNDRAEGEKETVLDKLVGAAKGSVLWASLACAVLHSKKTHSSFTETVDALKSSPKTISDIVHRLLEVMQLDTDGKLVLSWLFAAERPLMISEIKTLLKINPDRGVISETSVDLGLILRVLDPFIVVREDDGLVGLRHTAVEQAILSIPNKDKLSLHLTERHRELMTRLLIYAKSSLHGTRKPQFELLDFNAAAQQFHEHRLLEYTVRYWVVHFKKSKLMKATGPLELPSEIVSLFPKSVLLPLMERRFWDDQFTTDEATEMHLLAHRVRKACFGPKDACVLQSTIICALLLASLGRQVEATEYYFQATKNGRDMYGTHADIVLACCNHLLLISETVVSKERTTIMTYREESYLVIIEIYQHRYGEKSKQLLEIYQKLVELYILIGEEHKATKYYKIIHEITIFIHGSGSAQDNEISRRLDVEFRKQNETEIVDTYDEFLFGGAYNETEFILTIEYVRKIIIQIREIVLRGEFARAEELYIELWLRITHHCREVHNAHEWHEQKIRVMLLYASFLQERKRIVEASSILVCIWQEYEHHEFSQFESIIIVLKEVAVLMVTLSMFSYALAVLQKCRSWYKYTHKEELSIFKEIEMLISQTSVHIVESISRSITSTSNTSTTSTSTTISQSSETVMREVFESSISSIKETSITTIKLCESLSSICIKEKRYSEAVSYIETTLKKSWSSFFQESVTSISLTTLFRQETIDLVVKLIDCYIHMQRLETAEFYYLRLFRAIKLTVKVDDQLFVKYSELILAFYMSHGYYHKAITFYQELLVSYREFYGTSHVQVTKLLYKLGELCRKYQRTHGYWIEYYLEILAVLNKGSLICHEEALHALIIVAKYYYEDSRYSESLHYFKCILATFVKHGKSYKFFQNTVEVQQIFELYFHALQESKTDISVQISIMKEYREVCMSVFSATSSIVVHATFQLAETCTRSEKYEFEAISLYEYVHKHSESSTTVSREIVTKSQSTMRSLFVKQVTSKSTSTSTTVTKEMLETATTFSYQRYIEIKESYSCTHELVLSLFKDLIMLYYKREMMEVAIKEVRKLVFECVTKVTVAKELVATGKFLAELLHTCGYVHQGWEMVRELRLLVIYKSTKIVSTFDFDVATVGRSCFAFIAAFEYHLRAVWTITMADYMAELVAESLFYERFTLHIKSKASFELVFSAAARLRQTLSKRDRLEYFSIVEKKTIEYFYAAESTVVNASSRSSIESLVSLLLEYFTKHQVTQNFVAACGHAAEMRVRLLLSQKKHREALELTKCTYSYLMAHEGLDDETEVSLGWRLAVLMSNRGENRSQDPAIDKAMLDLSKKILGEVFEICENKKINLARCKEKELDELICLVGEQKDYKRLEWLLTKLQASIAGQSEWSAATKLEVRKRLVQAHASASTFAAAIRLCQKFAYNVRRTYGVRSARTTQFLSLLSSLYISSGLDQLKRNNMAAAMKNFRLAIEVHVNALKALVHDDLDDDLDSQIGSVTSLVETNGLPNGGSPTASASDHDAVLAIREHLRLLKLAFQRAGSFSKPGDVDAVTKRTWDEFQSLLKMNKEDVLSAKWSAHGYGDGRAANNQDEFKVPITWTIKE